MIDILIDYRKKEDLDNYIQASSFIVNSKEFSCYNDEVFNVDDAISIAKEIHLKGKKAILNMDRIFHDKDIKRLEEGIAKVKDIFDFYIFSDMAVFTIAEDLGIITKLIYDAKTTISSNNDLEYYKSLGIKCLIANELSKNELLSMNCSYGIEVFGYHQIFYSYRKLISMYKKFDSIRKKLKDKLLFLKEEIRDDLYLIYESKFGTFIYTPYIYNAYFDLKELENKIDFIRINCMFIDEFSCKEALEQYYDLLNNINNCFNLTNKTIKLSNGFLLNSSILLKGDNNE